MRRADSRWVEVTVRTSNEDWINYRGRIDKSVYEALLLGTLPKPFVTLAGVHVIDEDEDGQPEVIWYAHGDYTDYIGTLHIRAETIIAMADIAAPEELAED
ncbi:MAG TPA: hypothetical protein VK116_12490 [Planctomycetota bacterium]|nr:hypothetical protein [Planctomycetota bacterium]